MSTLNEHIDLLAAYVLTGGRTLDDALFALETWMDAHVDSLSDAERKDFNATLDQESSQDDRSLVDSILRLHATRLLFRYSAQQAAFYPEPDGKLDRYAQARRAFDRALQTTDEGINEARIDITIANAHQILDDQEANRHWLDSALQRLPDLAATDLVGMAQSIPPMSLPGLSFMQRLGLKLMGMNFDRLAQGNRDDLASIARLQITQIVLLAHLVGISYEAIRERQRARRAFRVAAHLVVRHQGLPAQDTAHLLDMAESLKRFEAEAAHILAKQALTLCEQHGDAEGAARAQAVLS